MSLIKKIGVGVAGAGLFIAGGAAHNAMEKETAPRVALAHASQEIADNCANTSVSDVLKSYKTDLKVGEIKQEQIDALNGLQADAKVRMAACYDQFVISVVDSVIASTEVPSITAEINLTSESKGQ